MVRSKTNTIQRCHEKPYKAVSPQTKSNALSTLLSSSSSTSSSSSCSSTASVSSTLKISPLKHWQCLVTNCVGWMKNKIISTLDLVLNQNEQNQFLEYSSSTSSSPYPLLLEAGGAPQIVSSTMAKSAADSFSSPFHLLPIDVLAGTLIRYLPMSAVRNLKLCSRPCCELFEIAARNSSLLLLNSRPILVGPFSHRCPYTLPSQQNSSYLPILWTLRHFISLISKQNQTINYHYLSTHQSIHTLGITQYLDEQMRASVIDWMIEVSVEFKCVPSVLHYSVHILDQVLSHVSIPRRFFQLLGCVCLFLMSRPTSSVILMDLDDVMYMCDSQYSVEEVDGMIEFVERHLDDHSHRLLIESLEQQTPIPISAFLSSSSSPPPSTHHSPSSSSSTNTFFSSDLPLPIYSPLLTLPSFKISLNSPTMIHFLASIYNALHLPLVMYQCIEINSSNYSNPSPTDSDPTPTPSTAEHILLSIFLSDLSLLDYHLLQYSPFTIACAVICLTRLTLFYYGESQVLLTPYGLGDGRSREIKQLLKQDQHRLYILPDPDYLNKPFGLIWFEKFILQSDVESRSIRACIERLWMLHADYIGYVYPPSSHVAEVDGVVDGLPYTPHIINHHSHIFAGLREKYAPRDSHRDAIWQKLHMLPRDSLVKYLDQIFSPRTQTAGGIVN